LLFIKTFIAILLGALLQSYAGFGFGLLVLPLLLFFNFDFPSAVITVVTGSAIQKIIAVKYFKDYFKWSEIKFLFLFGITGLPIGIFFLYKASFLSGDTVKQIIGIAIFITLLLRWSGLSGKKRDISPKWGYFAGFLSGILNGFANIGGPPVVLWVLSHKWKNEKMRAMILALSLTFVPFQIITMGFVFGKKLIIPFIHSLEMIPAVLIGSWIGLILGDRLSEKKLVYFMEIILMIIAFSALVRPMFK